MSPGLADLAGNEALKRRLEARLALGTQGHAYLISGPEGSGRHTLAALLSSAMVCTGAPVRPCGCCAACRKAAAGTHPDIMHLAPEEAGKEISVRQIRALRADAYIRPNEAQRKVYVIERADRLNAAGQNALLKLLEEGPEYAAFLLIAENAGQLLPTVRSRCEVLLLTPPGEPEAAQDELARQVTQRWLAGDERGLAALCAEMEKLDSAQFSALLDGMVRALAPRRADDPCRTLRLAALLDELRRAAAVNAGAGHLAGWLCAAAGQQPETPFSKQGGKPL